jgi:hypothetical protein
VKANQVVPALNVYNTKVSTFVFALVKAGAVPLGHLTEAPHVIVRAVPSAVKDKVTAKAFVDEGILVKLSVVMLAFNDTAKTFPLAQFIVNVPEEIVGAVCVSLRLVIKPEVMVGPEDRTTEPAVPVIVYSPTTAALL